MTLRLSRGVFVFLPESCVWIAPGVWFGCVTIFLYSSLLLVGGSLIFDILNKGTQEGLQFGVKRPYASLKLRKMKMCLGAAEYTCPP